MTTVKLQLEGDTAHVWFSSEKGVNVFSLEVIAALGATVRPLAEDENIRFVVFQGRGKTFVAGADIKQMSGLDHEGAVQFGQAGTQVFGQIEALPQVTVAAVNGHALGGGCELALACDFRIATAKAQLGQPETHLGLIPGWGGTHRLPRLVGPSQARRMIYSGLSVDAAAAERIGLVDQVVADDDALEQAVAELTGSMRKASPAAIAACKRALLTGEETAAFAESMQHAQGQEGMRAFIEKRKAGWIK